MLDEQIPENERKLDIYVRTARRKNKALVVSLKDGQVYWEQRNREARDYCMKMARLIQAALREKKHHG